MTDYITHGSDLVTPLFIDGEIVENLDALDTASLKYSVRNRHAFTRGQAITAPADFAGFFVESIKPKMDGDVWDVTLDCRGLSGGNAERVCLGYPETIENGPSEWDVINVELMTTNRNRLVQGQLTGEFGGLAMVCTQAKAKKLDAHTSWYKVSATLQGILKFKGKTRQISATGRTLSGENVVWSGVQGGWTTPRPAEVQIAQVTVVDTFLSTTQPPTQLVPGSMTPEAAPPHGLFGGYASPSRSLWPNGWVFTPTADQLVLGVGLFRHTWTYVLTPTAVTA